MLKELSMERSINKKSDMEMIRRQLLKSGLVLAGGSLLASVAVCKTDGVRLSADE
jgi:hypothetical protein